ncbi:AAA family ATPase [Phycicoccus sonneratiae]|uniref:AAA family ATPase n=1 Tax=Phycicoccus sonneratiae TaxID=2807628 RepID=A0ABS2CMC2_9MICO|nr:AAA family ATPase [Phycicoccus sonneraticus]MBM6401031.1 AAA family ATPase [Phycicoccus sonneraticus]
MAADGPGRLLCVGGPPGSGKTTVGALVARAAGVALVDLDSVTTPLLEAVAAADGLPVDLDSPRFAALREARYACLAAVVADCVRSGVDVVAVAPFTREAADGSWSAWGAAAGATSVTTCWLHVPADLLATRVRARGLARDLAKAGAPVPAATVAPASVDLLVDAAGAGPDDLVARVLAGWSARP